MAEAYGHMHFIMSCVIPVTFPFASAFIGQSGWKLSTIIRDSIHTGGFPCRKHANDILNKILNLEALLEK